MMKNKIESYIKTYLENFRPYKDGVWCYEDGIILTGAQALYEATQEIVYRDFILSYLDHAVSHDGSLPSYRPEEYSIDNIDAGKALFFAWQETGNEKYPRALHRLFGQLASHPRTACGNWFHKLRYPYQIWGDGLYMAQPFMIEYALTFFHDPQFFIKDSLKQFTNVRRYLYDDQKQLYMHAYDENKVMQWADRITGRSPNCWNRAVGWLAMALVDCASFLENDEIKLAMGRQLIELSDGMLKHRDSTAKMWFQVVDQPNLAGNYLETSGSAMLGYAILKGVRIGLLPASYLQRGLETWDGIVNNMLIDGHLNNICQVAGLDNEKRDGSTKYYLSEKRVADEAKGVAPFMMLWSEVKRLGRD